MSEERFENEGYKENTSSFTPAQNEAGQADFPAGNRTFSAVSEENDPGSVLTDSVESAGGNANSGSGPDVIGNGRYAASGSAAAASDGPDVIGSRSYSNYSSGTASADSREAAGFSGSNYAGFNTNPASHESGNRSRYYSYDRSYTAAPPSGDPESPKKKKRRALSLVLAVLLVFIIGAGAGAYASGKSATASIQGVNLLTGSKSEKKVETKKKESAAEDTSSEEAAAAEEELTEKEVDSEQKKTTPSVEAPISRVQSKDIVSDDAGMTVADVAEEVMPSIVSVYNKYTEQAQFFGRSYTQEQEAAGSGIIIEQADGELLIVTNNHVVEGADSLSVQFINEENCEASLKGTDVSSDLAVISVQLSELSDETKNAIAISELGSSDSLRIGDHVIAIGNALGYGQSLTVGYVSALNREITGEDGITGTFIQTDAAINPGNSGGALLNAAGQVVGINSNKIGGSAIEGMGFAIPISKAIPIIDTLKQQESKTKVAEDEQGALGILGISVTSDVASAYGLPVGAYVEEIIDGSGAQKSDLNQGDIITAINGQTVSGMEALQEQLSFYKAGEEVTLTIQHPMEGGTYEEREITLTLSKRSDIQAADTPEDNYGGRNDREQQESPYEQQGGSSSDDFFPFFSFGF